MDSNDRLADVLAFTKTKTRFRSVYFVQCNEFVKIGVAWDVYARLTMLQTGCPYLLRLIHSFYAEDAETIEQDLHGKYGQYNRRGEWFELPAEIIQELEQQERTKPPVQLRPVVVPAKPEPPAPRIKRPRQPGRLTGYWALDKMRTEAAHV